MNTTCLPSGLKLGDVVSNPVRPTNGTATESSPVAFASISVAGASPPLAQTMFFPSLVYTGVMFNPRFDGEKSRGLIVRRSTCPMRVPRSSAST